MYPNFVFNCNTRLLPPEFIKNVTPKNYQPYIPGTVTTYYTMIQAQFVNINLQQFLDMLTLIFQYLQFVLEHNPLDHHYKEEI